MSLFGNGKFTSHLGVPSFLSSKIRREDPPPTLAQEVSDGALDLELSFASTMSLNSPVRESKSLYADESMEYVPMDISPAPHRISQASATAPSSTKPPTGRPRAATSAARLFGGDMSNGYESSPTYNASSASKLGTSSNNSKRLQRAALPTEWLAVSPQQENATADSEVGLVLSCNGP